MIKFGTDGWRAVIGDAFTYANVRKVARAHALALKEKGLRRVIVGYDRRFSSEDFALEAYAALKEEGLDVKLSESACTTPMVSYAVKYRGFDGGVMITASHNPPKYNGYKIKESFGGSATPEFIELVESKLPEVSDGKADVEKVEREDLRKGYLEKLKEFVEVEALRERDLLVVHDPMHGTSAGLLAEALTDTKVKVLTIRGFRDPLFGGSPPEPVEKNLGLLMEKVRALGADLGVANDGDGDRIALVDERGNFINTQLIYALLLLHILKNKGYREGVVVKTVSTTYLANRICRSEGIPIKEVPVGFKNINEVILKEKVIFGGEESGGYGFPAYLPERDGIMSALLVLESMSLADKPISEIIKGIFREYGEAFYKRVDLPADEEKKNKLKELIQNPPERFAGRPVERAITIDGLKLLFSDDSWILFRASGTEPLIRVYAEAPSREEVDKLISEGLSLGR